MSARLDVLETAVRGGTAVLQKDVREVREGVAALEAKAADAAAAAAAPASSAKASERSEPGGIPPDERRAEREDLGLSSEASESRATPVPSALRERGTPVAPGRRAGPGVRGRAGGVVPARSLVAVRSRRSSRPSESSLVTA